MYKIKKLFQCIIDKNIRTAVLGERGFYGSMSDYEYLKRRYRVAFGKDLDLERPQTFNEKLQWLKLYDRKPEYTVMADKYKVREYIKEKLGEEYLIPLLGVWDDPEQIDFQRLPDQFVLKCNHNSGLGMYICKDKSKIDLGKVRKGLKKGLEQDYYLTGREWPYKNIERRIICEKFIKNLSDVENESLKDYKFYCFDGNVKIVMVNQDRNTERPTKADYFDRDYNWLDFTWGYGHAEEPPKRPVGYKEMIEIAELLSRGIPHVRVDLYNCAGKIYFGELTFFDGSGFDKISPEEWDYKIGTWLKLPAKA